MKLPPIKKVVVVTTPITELKPEEKPAAAYSVKATCLNSAAYNASTPCQTMLGLWLQTADALEANQKAQTANKTERILLESQELGLVLDYDNGVITFGSTVQSTAKDDPTIAAGMAMPTRLEAEPPIDDVATPEGVRIATVKKTGAPKLLWDAVPGAVLYVAQISPSPASDTSWSTVAGRGKSRGLPPLAPNQAYLLRVAATGLNGKQSPWSLTVSIIGKVM